MTRKQKAGHRRWGARGGKVPGSRRGDIMAPQQRSKVMSRIRAKDTSPELALANQMAAFGLMFERHCPDLPGKPDFVFRGVMVAVFVDGDFWHGFRFPLWQHKLSPNWRKKIGATRARDRKNFSSLRRRGWTVLRIWEHQIERDPTGCANRASEAVRLRVKKIGRTSGAL